GTFVFIIPEEFAKTDVTKLKWYSQLPKNSILVTENGNNLHQLFLKSVNRKFNGEFPVIYVVNANNELIFFSEGYRIGLGDALLKTIKK
ncbi:MAG TPA: hypothetical protein DCQ31_08075, partial [Bacteroidales bacterium]|nr:hypothetical protein [Bacteroidales bacterium]